MIGKIRAPLCCLILTCAFSLVFSLSCGRQANSSADLFESASSRPAVVAVVADAQSAARPAVDSPAPAPEELPPPATPAPQVVAASRIPLGPGFTNNFNHVLVRTAQDRLYVLINNDTPAKIGAGPGYLAMLRATSVGAASGFVEQDRAHRPVSGGSYIVDASMAIDGQGVIHVVFHDRDADGRRNGQLRYITFNTGSDTWGRAETVLPRMSDAERGYGGTAISLDREGVPHLVYANQRQIFYRYRSGSAWSAELQISDAADEAQHPSIAHGPDNRVHIAWHLRDPGNEIRYRSRSADGRFDREQSVVRYRRTSLNDVDQGPMLTLTADGTLWCAYLDGDEHIRVRRLSGDHWLDDGPPGDVYAHSPTIAAVNNDLWLLLGHDDQIDYALVHKPAGRPWRAKQTLESGKFDGSANARWSWFFNGSSPILDTLFFDEGEGSQLLATIFYRAIDTRGVDPTPSRTATPTPEPSATRQPTMTPTPEPSATRLPLTPTPKPRTITPTPKPSATRQPTMTPTPERCSGLQTPLLDDFDRENGPIGAPWRGETDGYTLAGGRLLSRNGGAIVYEATYGPDQEVYVTLLSIPARSEELDLLLKVQNQHWSHGALELLYHPAAEQAQVWSYAPASGWLRHGDPLPLRLAPGDQLGARSFDDQLEVYHNGTLVGVRSIAGWPFIHQGGAIGLWSIDAHGALFDNFGGGSHAPSRDVSASTQAARSRTAAVHRIFTPFVANKPCLGSQP